MSAVLTSPEDIVNDALVRIGYPTRIGSMYEGSDASKAALDIYGQTRDQMLRDGDWGFARRDFVLTLLKSAPAGGYGPTGWNNTYPPMPYRYEYTYPADALKVRAIKQQQIFVQNFDPQPVVYDTPNDSTYDPPVKVIVTNVPVAVLVYTAQVTDPTTWEASFTEGLSTELARRLAPTLMPDKVQMAAADEQLEVGIANVTQG